MTFRSNFAIASTALFIFLAGCGKQPEVTAVKVSRGPVISIVTGVSSGTVTAEKSAELAFGAVGRVQSLSVKVGDHVEAGAVLSELENVDLKQSYKTAENELDRRKNLREGRVISESEYESVVTQYELTKSALEKTFIRAPFAGVVTELNLEVGQLSQITAVIPKPLIRLVDNQPRYLKVDIDEADMARVKTGLPATVKIIAVRREPFSGTVRKVIPFVSSVREQDRTAHVELSINPDKQILPAGASADVEIQVEKREDVLRAPTRAVFGRGGERYVFELRESKAYKVTVKVGIYNFEFTEITSGISEGQTLLLPSDTAELTEGLKVRASNG